MSTQGGRTRFPLLRGVETGRAGPAREYRVDVERQYEVFLHQRATRELVGTCSIQLEPSGSHSVVPEFDINFEPADCEFWGQWRTDEEGVGHLHHVWLTVQGA